MSNQVYASEADAVGKAYIDQRVSILEATVLPGPGAAGKMAYYNGVGTLTDANITVTGVANDLTFDNNTTIFVDNIQSTDGDLNLGGGVTNLITVTSAGTIAIDATTSITLGHVGFTVNIVDKLDVMNIDTSVIDSSGTLIVGPTAPNILVGQIGSDVEIVDGAPFIVQNINHLTALTIGDATPDVNIGQAAAGNVTITTGATLFATAIDSVAAAAFLYNTCPSVSFGGFAGNVQFNGGLTFAASGGIALNYYTDQYNTNVTGTGPDVSQVIGNLALSRVGPIVTISFRWTAAPIVTVPATAIVTFDVAIDAVYRPTVGPVSEICRVYVNGVTAQGSFVVDNAGVLTLYPTGTGSWALGQTASADCVTLIYNVNM
jgi:hypothetical protein